MKSERATQRMLTAFGSSKDGAVALTRVSPLAPGLSEQEGLPQEHRAQCMTIA